MVNVTLFSKILEYIPHSIFSVVWKYITDKHSKGINKWTHKVAMLFCHFANTNSAGDFNNGFWSIKGNANYLVIMQSSEYVNRKYCFSSVRFIIEILLIIIISGISSISFAQLSGTKNIPGIYSTIAAAIADLNTQGVADPGVSFIIAAGYTETLPSLTAGLITATGTATAPIVFKTGTGSPNALITAYSPGGKHKC